ncbi:MAG: cytochrome b N-terminal domain-containing protein [Thermoguttaceae bacterium]
MKFLVNWLNDRTGIRDTAAELAETPLAGGAGWRRVLPAVVVFVFCVQVISGFFIWVYYSPSTQNAWESTYYLKYEVLGGWFLLGLHHYAGQFLLGLTGLYVLQLIVLAWYRAPGEAVFWTALMLFLCALALLLTGDLLPWTQNGYAATEVRTKFLLLLPGIGDALYKIAIGGPEFGQLTLTRFLALHVGLFSAGFVLLLVLNRLFARRANATLALRADFIDAYWPDQAWRNAIACLAVLGAILILVLQHGLWTAHAGTALGAPADTDPANYFAAARPEWALRGIYEFAQFFPGNQALLPIFIVPALIFVYFLLMPFIGRIKIGHYLNVAVTLCLLTGVAVLTYRSYAKDGADATHQNALADEQSLALRAVELAQAKGIPPAGVWTLLRKDSKTQGPKLFKQYCAGCHNAVDHSGQGIKATESSAANLHEFASRQWLAGLLSPKTIVTDDYWGNTKLRRGTMANFVKDNLGDLDAEEKNILRKVIAALSAEARLPFQREIDNRDAVIIREGRKAISEVFSCTDCHKYHEKGVFGGAPNLTGYGSSVWLKAFISNPQSNRFYGKKNDRMPAFAESGNPTNDLLSGHALEMISDWLRGR